MATPQVTRAQRFLLKFGDAVALRLPLLPGEIQHCKARRFGESDLVVIE
jgi:hypothetical protein